MSRTVSCLFDRELVLAYLGCITSVERGMLFVRGALIAELEWTISILGVFLGSDIEAPIKTDISRGEGGTGAVTGSVLCHQRTRCLAAISFTSDQDDLRLGEIFSGRG